MYEKLIAFTAGFFVAFLVVKAIRSFRTIGMCWIMGMLIIPETMEGAAGLMYYRITNSAPQMMGYEIYRNGGLYQGKTGIGSGTSANSSKSGGGTWYFVLYYPYGPTVVYTSPTYDTSSGDQWFQYTWTGQADATYYWACISVTNPCPSTEIAVIDVFVGGNLVGSIQDLIPAHGTYTKCLTNSEAFTWQARPFLDAVERECALPPQNGVSDDATMPVPPGNDVNPGGGSTQKGPIDPDEAVGTNIVENPNLTNQQWDRQNMAWLIQELNKIAGEILAKTGIDYRPWLNTITNQLGSIDSKTFDYREYWKTNNNQNTAMTNFLSIMTNLQTQANTKLDQIKTNTAMVATNTSMIETNTRAFDTNNFLNSMSNNWETASNTAAQKMTEAYQNSGLANWTNFSWRNSATGLAMPADDFLTFNLGTVAGVTHKIDLNYTHWQASSLIGDVVGFANWIQFWLGWVIALALYIAVVYRLDELWPVVMGDLRENTKISSSASLKGMAAKVGVALPLIAMFAAFFIVLPTICCQLYASYASHGLIGNPLNGVGTPIDHVANGTIGGVSNFCIKAAKYLLHLILMSIPWGVAATAFMNWIVFFQSSRFIANLLGAALWAFQKFLPLLILAVSTYYVQAGPVRFENLLGTNTAVSNNTMIISIFAGEQKIEQLEAGTYNWGNTNFNVPAWDAKVVRFTINKDNGQPMMIEGDEISTYNSFMWGMVSGFSIFGAAWGVSAAWQGWNLRHGGA